ncbi:2-dehydropantoate 2-reductase [Staphylococcus warneri]|uniref:oxidoreductase n=1 Tax=Staphylococcus TaxID=1279 RepID=UPI000F51FA0C|nr:MULTISPECIES: oxidoreductase [Staphylococcus]MCI2748834.1 oxidoreductase [Staphylococcus warneri]MCI2776453.1 oxidoreductase [Staphylococcus warneri]QSF51865.1 oxidoreductase [Staphylococcus sp. SB1-57]RQM98186.1 2-dehydropantoate 2-reductase [Staphylococcus warneri]
MTIGVIGPGAVGTTIAIELQQAYPDTLLIGKQKNTLNYFPENGHQSKTISVTPYQDITQPLDIVFIVVKTYQLETVITQLSPIIHEETIIILAQNGYGQLERIPFPNSYQAVVYISGQKNNNDVTHFRDYRLHLKDTPRTRKLQKLTNQTNIEIILEENIEEKIWYKLLVNLGINSITALGRDTAKLLRSSHIRNICRGIISEGISVARAEGLNFDVNTLDSIMTIYEGYPDQMGTSMYYDITSGRPLEMESIQGYIYKKAQEYHITTPYLDTVYAFLSAYQSQF